MTTQSSQPNKLRVIIVGGGVAALETALALHDLAGELVELTVIAPNDQFFYRPMTVREPFAFGAAKRYPLQPILDETNAKWVADGLSFVDPDKQIAHTNGGVELPYDVLTLAMGAKAHPRYTHAITIDAASMDETLHGIIQDVEQGYVKSLAFVAPARMPWQLPMYELALMAAGRAYDMNVDLEVTIVTPEDAPLAIFGSGASTGVAELLERAKIQSINSAYAEVPRPGEVVINPGDRRLHFDRVIALPELFGPSVRGIPLGENGFIRVNQYGKVPDVGPIFAAGDVTNFAVKHGGISAQQADVAAESIAALAGAPVTPKPFDPVIHGMLLTDSKPVYLTAHIAGGHGFSSEISDTPTWSPATKIAAKYLAPYLDALDHEGVPR